MFIYKIRLNIKLVKNKTVSLKLNSILDMMTIRKV